MKRKTTFRHWIEAMLIMALPMALRPLPFASRVRFGGWLIGGAIYRVPKLRGRIRENLRLIYPEMPDKERAALESKIARNIGARYIELFYSATFQKRLSYFHCADGALDEIRAARAEGRPVILVSGHFGVWEAGRVLMREAGMESGGVYKESANPVHEKRHAKNLSHGGKPMFNTSQRGVRGMLKHLKNGGILAILLDQRVNDGEVLDFMGQPALTSTITATLALKYNALLVPVYGVFRENGQDIDTYFEPAIPHSDATTMTQALNDSLAARVRKNPEQWYWLHNRWARPDLERKRPPKTSA